MIDPKKQIAICIDFIQTYFKENGTPDTKAVIGISGGKDSTIAAALLVRALGPERVVCVMMPQGKQTDIEDSYQICDILNIPDENRFEINVGPAVDALYGAVFYNGNDEARWASPAVLTNTPARIRMTTLYMVAAAVGGRVCNTGNASEAFIGYTTKYGDLAGDFALLRDFTVREVYAIGDALEELPYNLVHKAPADGMSGKTDEDNMGIPYEVIDNHLLYGFIPANEEMWENIKARHKRNYHKMETIHLRAPHRESGFLHNKVWD